MAPDSPDSVVASDAYARNPLFRWLALAAALLAWTFDGVEQGVYMVNTRPALKELVPGLGEKIAELDGLNATIARRIGSGEPRDPEVARKAERTRLDVDRTVSFYFGLAFAMWLWGAAVGGVIFGRLGDRYGRIRPLVVAVLTYSVFTGASAFSTHWGHLAVCRFLGALGLGGTWPLSVAIIVETWPERNRSVLAGLMGAGANVGYLIASTYSLAMTRAGYDWRWIIGMGFFVGILSLPVIAFVPETTRWKQSRAEARRSSLGDLFGPRYLRSTVMGSLLSTIALLGTWGSFLWFAAYIDQISEGTPAQGTARSTVSLWQAFGQIGGGFLGGVLARWMGNRRAWLLLCFGAWAFVSALYFVNRTYEPGTTIPMAIVAGIFVTAFFGWLPKFLPELYPTRIRATGQGFAYNIGRVLTGFGVLGGGGLVGVFGGDYRLGMMVMASIYLIGLPLVLLAPDTGGKLTEEEAPAA